MKTKLSIVFAAAAIRLLALWLVPEPHLSSNAMIAYLKGAQILLEGQGFSDFYFPVYTPPFYSMCIAMVTFLFGGEGLFYATVTGPGKVWLQSLPFSRLAARVVAAAGIGRGRKEEGSLLGPLGNLLDGDR